MVSFMRYEIKAPDFAGHFARNAPPRTYEQSQLDQMRRDLKASQPEPALDRLFRLIDTKADAAHRLGPQLAAIAELAIAKLPPVLRPEYAGRLGLFGLTPTGSAPVLAPRF